MFGVAPQAVEDAWTQQYLSYNTQIEHLDDQRVDPAVLDVLSRRQAWQLMMMPLRREDGQLILATTRQRLTRAINFTWRRLNEPVLILIAPQDQLESCLQDHYPWPAMIDQPALIAWA